MVRLYECGKVEIVIANPFDENVEFAIKIKNINKKKTEEIKNMIRITSKNKRKGKSKGKSKLAKDIEFKNALVESLVPMFFTKQKLIKIKKHSATKFTIFYQPLTFEPHQAQISKCLLFLFNPSFYR